MCERRGLISAAVVAAVIGAARLVGSDREDDRSDPGDAIASSSRIPLAPAKAPLRVIERAPVEHDMATAGADAERVEVCGMGWVDARADGSVDVDAPRARPQAAVARDRLIAALRKDAGGMGEFVAIDAELNASRVAKARLASSTVCRGDTCALDADDAATARRLMDRLATVASGSGDADLYEFAYRRCQRSPTEGACALLNAAQWSRLDPGNALPWLFQLERASEQKDRAAIDDALFHIGSAARLDERPRRAFETLDAHIGSTDIDVFVGGNVMTDIYGGHMAMPLPFAAVSRACQETPADANRQQACDAAATTLADRSDSQVFAMIGNTVGRRLGWSEDRLDQVDMRQLAGSDHFARTAPAADLKRTVASTQVSLDCKSLRAEMATLGQLAVRGEAALSGEWLATEADRESIRQRARSERADRIERERKEKLQRAVWAASAASTPYSAIPPPAR